MKESEKLQRILYRVEMHTQNIGEDKSNEGMEGIYRAWDADNIEWEHYLTR